MTHSWSMGMLITVLSLLPAITPTGQAAEVEVPAPQWHPWIEPHDDDWRIDWRNTWQATLEATRAAWPEPHTPQVERRRHLQQIQLLRALLERFTDAAPDQRAAAYEQIAEHYAALGTTYERDAALRELVMASGEHPEHQFPVLSELLEGGDEPYFGPARVRFAAPRVLAMVRQEKADVPAELHAKALQANSKLARGEGRLFTAQQAARALAQLEEVEWAVEWAMQQQEAMRQDAGLGGASSEPALPVARDLRERWRALADRTPLVVPATLLSEAGQRTALHQHDERRHRAMWLEIDAALRAQRGAGAAVQHEPDAEELPTPSVSGDPAALTELMAAYRRDPLSERLHVAMLRWAEHALRTGVAGIGERLSEDVLAHSVKHAHRDTAQRLLTLAQAQTSPPSDRGPADPEARQPDLRVLHQPAVHPWPIRALGQPHPFFAQHFSSTAPGLQAAEVDLVLSAPGVIACYGPGDTAPRWVRHLPSGWSYDEDQGDWAHMQRRIVPPGRFRVAVSDELLITRWGLDATHEQMTTLVALNRADGQMRWSTAGDPAWTNLRPVGDPVVADGRVYALAQGRGLVVDLSLVCLSARTGRMLWERKLMSQDPTVSFEHARNLHPFNLTQFGSGLTVHCGAVYALTNLGVVMRIDARDGVVEWTHRYGRAADRSNWRALLGRSGGGPHVVAGKVIFAPRDHSGVFALDTDSGALAWQQPILPSDRLVGPQGDRVVFAGGGHAAAIDAITGERVWDAPLPGRLLAATIDRRGHAIFSTPDGLWQHAPDAAASLERRDVGLDEAPSALLVHANRLVALSPAPAHVQPQPKPPGVTADTAAKTLLPHWQRAAIQPQLYTPPAHAAGETPQVLMRCGSLLRLLQPEHAEPVRWRRFVPPAFEAVGWSEDILALVYHDRVLGLDRRSGAVRWRQRLDYTPDEVSLRISTEGTHALIWPGQYRSMAGLASQADTMTMLDLSTGEILWQQSYEGRPQNRLVPLVILWDQDRFHIVDERSHNAIAVRRSDGLPLGHSRYLPDGVKMKSAAVSGERVYVAAKDMNSTGYAYFRCESHQGRLIATDVLLFPDPAYAPYEPFHEVLAREDPAALAGAAAQTPRRFGAGAGRTFLIAGEPHQPVLEGIDLASGQTTFRSEPFTVGSRVPWMVRRAVERDGRLLTLSPVIHREHLGAKTRTLPDRSQHLRVDAWDLASGEHLAGAQLAGVPDDLSQIRWIGDTLVFATGDSVSLFRMAQLNEPPTADTAIAVPRLDRPIQIDARLDDWPNADPEHAEWTLRHDGERLIGRVVLEAAAARPHHGSGDSTGGDWLELVIGPRDKPWHLALGAVVAGEADCHTLEGHQGPADPPITAAVRHEPLADRLIYEFAVPLEAMDVQPGETLRGGLVAWSDVGAAWLPLRRTLIGGTVIQSAHPIPSGLVRFELLQVQDE